MKVQEIITALEGIAPLHYAEDFDNVGLLTGDASAEVQGVLITLDTLEAVVDEAIERNCNLIVSFHPIIFKGLKSLTGKTYVERVVMKAIKHDVAIYSMHTALDNQLNGVNATICDRLGLSGRKILIPQGHTIRKLITYVPHADAEKVRQSLFAAGAGAIGNYSECSFNLEGEGTYKGNALSHPTLGERGVLHTEGETQIGVIFPKHLQGQIVSAMWQAHPYEEVAYEIYTLENTHQGLGMGMIGELSEAMEETAFLAYVKEQMGASCIRHSALRGKVVKKVAVLGGSGAFAIGAAKAAGVDAFVSADFKYHDFFTAEGKLLLADIGHFESEQFIKMFLFDALSNIFCNFAFSISNIDTNPIKYYS